MGSIIGQRMEDRFLSEAKGLFELENGRESLPTVNALCLMYLTSALLGRDRAGLMYRHLAYEMLKRLGLERKFNKLSDDDPQEVLTRNVLSKALWGLFCFEG